MMKQRIFVAGPRGGGGCAPGAPLPGFKNVVGVIGQASLPGSPGPVPTGVRSSLTAWDVLPCWQLLQGI